MEEQYIDLPLGCKLIVVLGCSRRKIDLYKTPTRPLTISKTNDIVVNNVAFESLYFCNATIDPLSLFANTIVTSLNIVKQNTEYYLMYINCIVCTSSTSKYASSHKIDESYINLMFDLLRSNYEKISCTEKRRGASIILRTKGFQSDKDVSDKKIFFRTKI